MASKKPNNLLTYGKNVGRSLVYTSVDTIKEMNPVLKSFSETNAELTKEAFAAVKDYKGTIKKTKKILSENQYVKLFDTARKNFLEDLKTGNWYNKERDEAISDRMNFDEEDDWEWSDESSDDSDSIKVIESDTDRSINTMNSVGEAASNAVAKATVNSADYVARVTHQGTKSILEQNKKHFAQVNLNLAALNSNLTNLVKLGEPITTHINNSAQFYTRMRDLTEDNNRLLKEILVATKANGVEVKKGPEKLNRDYNYVVNSKGVLDVSKYMETIKHNVKTKYDFMGDFMDLEMGGANILESMVSMPIAEILKEGVARAIPKGIKKASNNLNKTLSDTFSSLFMNLNSKANDLESPEIFRILNDIFGINMSAGAGLKTDIYEKGKVNFDGITRKSITEVIPTYLAKILAAVSGEEEIRYNYKIGKFEKISAIQKVKNREDDKYYNNAVKDFRDSGIKTVDKLKLSKFTRQEFDEDFETFLRYLYNNSESFNYKNKNIDASKYGISPESLELIRTIYKTNEKSGKGSLNTNLNTSILNNRSTSYNVRTNANRNGDDVFLNLINGSLGYKPEETNSTEYYSKLKSQLLVDDKGNDIFFYLQDYYNQLGFITTYMSKSGTGGTGGDDNNTPLDIGGYRRNIPVNKKNKLIQRIENEAKEKDKKFNSLVRRQDRDGVSYSLVDENDNDLKIDSDKLSDVLSYKQELSDAAKEAKDKQESIFTKLKEAKTINDKYKTIVNNIEELANKPAKFLASVLHKADERLYNVLYSDNENNEEEGFIDLLKRKLNDTFDEVLDKSEDLWEKTKKSINGLMNKTLGFDMGDVKEYANNIIWGKDDGSGERSGGILGEFVRNTKDSLKEMWTSNISDPFNKWLNTHTESDEDKVGNAATGGKVTKTGVIAVTGGEYIIPAPGDKKEQLRKENIEKQKFLNYVKSRGKDKNYEFLGNYKDGGHVPGEGNVIPFKEVGISGKEDLINHISNKFKVNDKEENVIPFKEVGISGKEDLINHISNKFKVNDKEGNSNKTKTGSSGVSNIEDYINSGIEKAYNAGTKAVSEFVDEKYRDKVETVMKEAGSNVSTLAAGGLVGGGFSLLTGMVGGPLLGAAVGAGLSLIGKSENVQKSLFGEKDPTTGEYKSELGKFMDKKAPDMVKYGLGGGLIGTFFGGPIVGTMVGAALGYAKNTEEIKNAFFGKGAIAEGLDEKIKKSLPAVGAGAAAGLLFGPLPIGLVGNAMVGAAVGFAADTTKFGDLLFGKKDKEGKRHGGIAGALKKNFVKPLADFAKNYVHDTKEFFTEKVFQPIDELMDPIRSRIRNKKNRMAEKLKKKIRSAGRKFGGNVVKIAGRRLAGSLGRGATSLARVLGVEAPVYTIGGLAKLPFRVIGKGASLLNNRMRDTDTLQGFNDYETIDEQIERYDEAYGKRAFHSRNKIYEDHNGSMLELMRDLDPVTRQKVLLQLEMSRSAKVDSDSFLLSKLKKDRKDIWQGMKEDGISSWGESKIRKAMMTANSVEEFNKILDKYDKRGLFEFEGVEKKSQKRKELEEIFAETLEQRKVLGNINTRDTNLREDITEILRKATGNDKLTLTDNNFNYLEKFASVNSGNINNIFGEADARRTENSFFNDLNSDILARLNSEELTEEDEKILKKYITDNKSKLDTLPENHSFKKYINSVESRLNQRGGWSKGWVDENKTQNDVNGENVEEITDNVSKLTQINEESKNTLADLLENSRNTLAAIVNLSYQLTGNDSLVNRVGPVKNRGLQLMESSTTWDEFWNSVDPEVIEAINSGNFPEEAKKGLIERIERQSKKIGDINNHKFTSEVYNKFKNNVQNKAFGGKVNSGLAVVSKGEEITTKVENTLTEIKDMIFKKFNQDDYIVTDKGGIVRLRRDNKGSMIADMRDRETQDSIEDANEEANLLKEIRDKMDNMNFGPLPTGNGDDEEDKDKNEDDGGFKLPKDGKSLGTSIAGAIAAALSGLPAMIGAALPAVQSLTKYIYMPLAALGLYDDEMAEKDDYYKEYEDPNGNKFGTSYSDDIRSYMFNNGIHKLAGWDKLNLGERINNFITDTVKKHQDKKLNKKVNKVKKTESELQKTKDRIKELTGRTDDVAKTVDDVADVADGASDVVKAGSKIDEAADFAKRLNNLDDGADLVDQIVDMTRGTKNAKSSFNLLKNTKLGKLMDKAYDKYQYVSEIKDNVETGASYATKTKNVLEGLYDSGKEVKQSKKLIRQTKNAQRYAKWVNRGRKITDFVGNLVESVSTKFKNGIIKAVGKLANNKLILNHFPKFANSLDELYKNLDDWLLKGCQTAGGQALQEAAEFVDQALTVVTIPIYFLDGYNNAATYWGILDKDVTNGQEITSGIVNCIVECVGLSLVFRTDKILDFFYKVFSKVDPDLMEGLKEDKEEASERLSNYNEESGEDLTLGGYNKKFYGKAGLWDSVKAKVNNNYKKIKNSYTYNKKKKNGQDTTIEEQNALLMKYQTASDSLALMAGKFDNDLEKHKMKMYVNVLGGNRGLYNRDGIVKMNEKVSSIATQLSKNDIAKANKLIESFDKKYPLTAQPDKYAQYAGYLYDVPKNVKDLNSNIIFHGIEIQKDGTWTTSKGNTGTNEWIKTGINTKTLSTDDQKLMWEIEVNSGYDQDGDGKIGNPNKDKGSGSGVPLKLQQKAGTFVSQLDPSIANTKFTENTTFAENGCAPAVAAMTVNSVKNGSINLKDAAKFATAGKYVNDDGTESSYFKDFLGKFGIKTNYIDNGNSKNTKNIKEQIQSGNNVILLGNDSSNNSKNKSPFGKNNHYVLATGMDKSGNIIVNDPESNKPKKYSSKILNKVKLGIATNTGGSGSGLGYRGGASKSMGDANLGFWSVPDENEFNEAIGDAGGRGASNAFYGRANVFLKAGEESGLDPRYILAHAAQESGWGTQSKYVSRNNYFGIGAFDSNPDNAYTFSDGTSSNDGLATGIIEGAKWIAKNYYNSNYKQTTVNKMRYNNGVHQYATDENWANAIANIMAKMPANSKLTYEETPNDAMPYIGDVSTSSGSTGTSSNSSGIGKVAGAVTGAVSNLLGGNIFSDAIDNAFKAAYGDGIFNFLKSFFGFGNSDSLETTDGSTGTLGGITLTGPDASELTGEGGEDIVKYARSAIGKLKYSQDVRDIDSGWGDCSSFAQWAVQKATGINPGGNSNAIYTSDIGADVSVGSLREDELQPGDLLLYKRSKSNYTDKVGHVEVYAGDGKRIGHGGPNEEDIGAKESDISRDSSNFLKAKRFVATVDDKDVEFKNLMDDYNSINNLDRMSLLGEGLDGLSSNNKSSGLLGMGSGIHKSSLYRGGGTTATQEQVPTTNINTSKKTTTDVSQFATSASDEKILDAMNKKSTNNISSVVKALGSVIDQLSSISANTEFNAKIYELLLKYLVEIAQNSSGNTTIIAGNNNEANSNSIKTNESLKELSSYLNMIAIQ